MCSAFLSLGSVLMLGINSFCFKNNVNILKEIIKKVLYNKIDWKMAALNENTGYKLNYFLSFFYKIVRKLVMGYAACIVSPLLFGPEVFNSTVIMDDQSSTSKTFLPSLPGPEFYILCIKSSPNCLIITLGPFSNTYNILLFFILNYYHFRFYLIFMCLSLLFISLLMLLNLILFRLG